MESGWKDSGEFLERQVVERFRFGDFELDVERYELRRHGRPVRLERQPMDVLIMLVERRTQLVSRTDIVDRLWGKDVFVDVDTGVHTAIRKVRQALRDSREQPVFVETVSGKGYRFIASVQVVSTAAEGDRVTLAVLPFENLGGDPDREYLADGLTEETIASLGQVDPDRVSVVGRTSVRSYKGTTTSAAAIGDELGADYLVESSIRSESGRVRITVKLIRTRDQVQVWSESYDREPAGMLRFQQELSSAIAEQIRFRLSPDRLNALARRQPRDAEAYDLYLRGWNFANQRTPPTTEKAIEYFTRATTLDPTYALAWSGLSLAYSTRPINSDAPPLDVWPRAREAALQAVRADPNLAEAQYALGYLNWLLDWDWSGAEAALRRAADLDPRYAPARWTLGHALSQMGRHSEASPLMRRARELDPLFAMTYALSSQVAFQARDAAAALDHASQAIVLDQDFWIGHMMRAQALEQLGEHDLALDALTMAARFSNENSKAISLRGYILAKLGRTAEARRVLAALETRSHERYVPPFALALVHAGLGEHDAVFALLDKAFDARDVHLIYLPVDPKWDRYRGDARFDRLLSRCGFSR